MTDEHHSGKSESYSRSDNDIERSTYEHGAEPWKDPHALQTLYHQRGYSQQDIADRYDIRQQTVCYWMGKFDIETEPPMHKREPSISKSELVKDKVQYKVPDGDGGREHFQRHQLVALLCTDVDGEWSYSADDIFGRGSHVHHEMSADIAIDIPENLTVLSPAEHVTVHAGGSIEQRVEATLSELYEEYEGEPDPEDVPHPLLELPNADMKHRQRRWTESVSGD